jgi:MYXO-CTERM domain-containing protein
MRTTLLLLALGAPTGARADVLPPDYVPEPPPRCEAGSHSARPMRGHGWICEVNLPCSTDAECTGGARCEDTALCAAGTTAFGACRDGDVCSAGRCVRARRCVSPVRPPPPAVGSELVATEAPSLGGLCRAAVGSGSAAPLAAGALALFLAAGRRRRR